MTPRAAHPVEHLATTSLREDSEVRRLLEEGFDAYCHLRDAAEIARTPDRFLTHTFAWNDWDRALRACAQRLGAALLRACIERVGTTPHAEPAQQGEAPECPSTLAPHADVSAVAEPVEAALASDDAPWAEEATTMTASPASGAEAVQASGAQRALLTRQSMEALQARLRGGSLEGVAETPQEREAAKAALKEARAQLRQWETHHRERALSEALEAWTRRDALRGSLLWGRQEQHHWLEALAALTQMLRAWNPNHPTGAQAWGNLEEVRKQHKLDFIHGLSGKHSPKHGAWQRDAGMALDTMGRLLGEPRHEDRQELSPGEAQREVDELLERWEEAQHNPLQPNVDLAVEIAALLGRGMEPSPCILRWLSGVETLLLGKALAGLRKKIRKQRQEDEEEEAKQPPAALPSDWPYRSLTQGRAAVVIGSEGKGPQLEAIKRTFDFARVDHVPARDGERKAQALAASIEDNDPRALLMMHRHMSHKLSNRIWEHKDRAFVYGVETGFGVAAVRKAIEKHGPAYLKRLKEEEG